MKTLTLSAVLLTVTAFAALSPAPAPITTADVPDTISLAVPNVYKQGIVDSYNKAMASQYAEYVSANAINPAAAPAFNFPTPTNYIKTLISSQFTSLKRATDEDDLATTRVHDKWGQLTQAQRDGIKAALATVP